MESAEIFAEHFQVPAHRFIFMSMMYLYSKKVQATPMAIMEVLSSESMKDEVNKLGGLEYLMILAESDIPPDNLNIFVDKVKQSYTRASLVSIGKSIEEFAKSDKASVLNPGELISFADRQLADLSVTTSSSEDVYKMGDDTDRVLAERAENPSTVPGLEVGHPETDRITGGGVGGDLIIVCAESKTGKSVLLTNYAINVSVLGRMPSLYIDSEMTSRQQEDRILANLSGVPEIEIRNGMYVMDTVNGSGADKIERINKAKQLLKDGNFYHHYMPHFTIEKVLSLTRKFQMQHGIVALFFDYIKIPSNQGDFKSAQEYQKLGFFTSGLKDLAGMLNIPVWSACQANRDDMGGENPDASKIGGSYRILQLASKLMFLTNKSDERIAKDGTINGNQQLWIKYQRNGESDCPPINLFFNKPILRQTEV